MKMDKRMKAIFDVRVKPVEVELEQELIRISDKYARRGLVGSGLHLREQGLVKIKAKAKKEEIRARLEKEQKDETEVQEQDGALQKARVTTKPDLVGDIPKGGEIQGG